VVVTGLMLSLTSGAQGQVPLMSIHIERSSPVVVGTELVPGSIIDLELHLWPLKNAQDESFAEKLKSQKILESFYPISSKSAALKRMAHNREYGVLRGTYAVLGGWQSPGPEVVFLDRKVHLSLSEDLQRSLRPLPLFQAKQWYQKKMHYLPVTEEFLKSKERERWRARVEILLRYLLRFLWVLLTLYAGLRSYAFLKFWWKKKKLLELLARKLQEADVDFLLSDPSALKVLHEKKYQGFLRTCFSLRYRPIDREEKKNLLLAAFQKVQ
jgi:hypothetical protein